MAKSSVIFGVRNLRVEAQYDRSQLRLGSSVYVKFSESGKAIKFTPVQEDGTIRFAVTWIAPSEWYVILVDQYKPSDELVANLKLYCVDYIDAECVNQAVSHLASRIRIEHLWKSTEVRRSFLSSIAAVTERLDLCRRLKQSNVAKELFHHQRPLAIYLCLTCFDLLGQSTEWLDFGPWLEAHRCLQEREFAALTIPDNSSPDVISKAMYSFYCGKYGVKSGFFNFINTVLPPEQRQLLLDSILITNLENPPSLKHLPDGDEKEKLSYLFKIRNEYTHRAQFVPGVDKIVMPRPADCWEVYRQHFYSERWQTIHVKNWPEVLEISVRRGLAARLESIAHGFD